MDPAVNRAESPPCRHRSEFEGKIARSESCDVPQRTTSIECLNEDSIAFNNYGYMHRHPFTTRQKKWHKGGTDRDSNWHRQLPYLSKSLIRQRKGDDVVRLDCINCKLGARPFNHDAGSTWPASTAGLWGLHFDHSPYDGPKGHPLPGKRWSLLGLGKDTVPLPRAWQALFVHQMLLMPTESLLSASFTLWSRRAPLLGDAKGPRRVKKEVSLRPKWPLPPSAEGQNALE